MINNILPMLARIYLWGRKNRRRERKKDEAGLYQDLHFLIQNLKQ